MTPDVQAKFHEQRKLCAAAVMANAEQFKVCSQCYGIAYKVNNLCPLCHQYRFWEQPDAVILAASWSAMHPFPTTQGTVPRIDFPLDEKPAEAHIK